MVLLVEGRYGPNFVSCQLILLAWIQIGQDIRARFSFAGRSMGHITSMEVLEQSSLYLDVAIVNRGGLRLRIAELCTLLHAFR